MSSRWSALLASSRSSTALPSFPRHPTPPPPPPPVHGSVPHHQADPIGRHPSAAAPVRPTDSPDSPAGTNCGSEAPAGVPIEGFPAGVQLPWLRRTQYDTGGDGVERLEEEFETESLSGDGGGGQGNGNARHGAYPAFAPLPEQPFFAQSTIGDDERRHVAIQEDTPGSASDIGGDYAFTFDSPVLVPTRGVGERDHEHDAEYASPGSHAAYSPAEQPLGAVSPISPILGAVERESDTSYFGQQAVYGAPPGAQYPAFGYETGSTSAAPSYGVHGPPASSSSMYGGPSSAPTYSHDAYLAGPASYPPTFAAPLSMAAYQSFAYAQTTSTSGHLTSAATYDDDGGDAGIGYSGFAPLQAATFHPAQQRRVSTGGIFPHFRSPSHFASAYHGSRAPSPPRSSSSLLAANVPFVESTSPPLLPVKSEADELDLPPPLPQSPEQSFYGSPMSASSFGSGGFVGWAGADASGSVAAPPPAPSNANKYPSPSSSSSKHASGSKKPPHKRRPSIGHRDEDADYSPSSPETEAAPRRDTGTGGRPISPITGKPIKRISKRGWPPKDAHKRTYRCEVEGCGKTFGRPSARDTHMRSHTGVKPFTCPIPSCSRSFGVFSNLKRHMIVHPTVDFRQVSVHDLPHMRFVPDGPGAAPTLDGGRLEWIEEDEEDGQGMQE
ncbi:hypothetical protein DMC30DRAFT_160821 [Rhodotorula diobovata]|uniref:C2H2-type domain-containing protein n=1 Tax=Rhodotorula diobovata TaxID=5288 RepID=A0A5C5FZG5_9BASI|nr:hypothetical protein DMC30DRAFT_160821 [Rhodotorula diobovata]